MDNDNGGANKSETESFTKETSLKRAIATMPDEFPIRESPLRGRGFDDLVQTREIESDTEKVVELQKYVDQMMGTINRKRKNDPIQAKLYFMNNGKNPEV